MNFESDVRAGPNAWGVQTFIMRTVGCKHSSRPPSRGPRAVFETQNKKGANP